MKKPIVLRVPQVFPNMKPPSVTSSAGASAPRTCPYVTEGGFVFFGGAYGT